MKRNKMIFTLMFILVFSLSILNKSNALNQNEVSANISSESINRSSWFWDDELVLSEISSSGSTKPDIISDSNNDIHVVWGDYEDYGGAGSDSDIFYTMWDSTSDSWSPIEVVSTECTSGSSAPRIAVDQNNNIYVTWHDTTNYLSSSTDCDIFLKRYFSQNNSWTPTEVISTESTSNSFYPDIGVDGAGNIYIVWHDRTDYAGAGATDDDIFFKQWFSSNSSWTDTMLISLESTDDSTEAKVAVNDIGNVYIIWQDNTDNMVSGSGTDLDVYLKQRIFGENWSDLRLISSSSTGSSAGSEIVCNDNGALFIAWQDNTDILGAGSDSDIFCRSYNPLVKLWSDVEIVSTTSTGESFYCSLALDDFGDLHTVWFDFTDYSYSGTDDDIFYCRKDSQTDTWSSVLVVSLEENTGMSRYPKITTDKFGYAHVVCQDTTDLHGSSGDWDIFYRKFVGPPSPPILASFATNPSYLGNLTVEWNDVIGASSYAVYRENSYIWSVTELTPKQIISSSILIDEINTTGTYYYTIVAQNEYGISDQSNVESVVIIEEDIKSGFFQSLRIGEIFVLAAILGGFQLILAIATYSILKTSSLKSKSSKKK